MTVDNVLTSTNNLSLLFTFSSLIRIRITTMDLSKMTNDKKLHLCRWYFRAGFAFLPFVWTVNALWFFNEAFRKPEYAEQKEIRKYVTYSALGSLIWLVLITTWVSIFQVNRIHWGQFADDISFIIPLGSP